jgi:hypothetical protein
MARGAAGGAGGERVVSGRGRRGLGEKVLLTLSKVLRDDETESWERGRRRRRQ